MALVSSTDLTDAQQILLQILEDSQVSLLRSFWQIR